LNIVCIPFCIPNNQVDKMIHHNLLERSLGILLISVKYLFVTIK